MKFTTAFIVSILTSSVYGLATAPIAREDANIEVNISKVMHQRLAAHYPFDHRL